MSELCAACKGSGFVAHRSVILRNGKSAMVERTCSACDGSGVVEQESESE